MTLITIAEARGRSDDSTCIRTSKRNCIILEKRDSWDIKIDDIQIDDTDVGGRKKVIIRGETNHERRIRQSRERRNNRR